MVFLRIFAINMALPTELELTGKYFFLQGLQNSAFESDRLDIVPQ